MQKQVLSSRVASSALNEKRAWSWQPPVFATKIIYLDEIQIRELRLFGKEYQEHPEALSRASIWWEYSVSWNDPATI